jgi:hypothetical protein
VLHLHLSKLLAPSAFTCLTGFHGDNGFTGKELDFMKSDTDDGLDFGSCILSEELAEVDDLMEEVCDTNSVLVTKILTCSSTPGIYF